jgi:molybdopterin synthase sulfur carrier subunit
MPRVIIPPLLRELSGGVEETTVPGETVREVIEALDQRYPGIRERLCEGDRLRPGLAIVVDGQTSAERLRHRLSEKSEVHFLPAISGG